MTIERVKINWGPNEELTADQINAVDTNATYALDKRQGETDTLSSTVTVDGYADITYQSGSVITHEADSIETYDTDSAVYLHGLTDFDGFSSHNSGDVVNFYSGSLENHLSGSVDHYQSGSIVTHNTGSTVTHNTGSTVTHNTGSTVNLNGLTYFDGVSVHNNGDSVGWLSGSTEEHLSGNVDHYASGAIMINDGYGEFADLRLSGTSKVNYKTTRSYVRSILPVVDSDWVFDYAAVVWTFEQSSTVHARAYLDLHSAGIPNGAVIKQIDIFYNPNVGGHVDVPVNLPNMKLIRKVIGRTGGSVMFTEQTVAANVAAYETPQTLTKVINMDIDYDTYSYFLIFTGEVGFNSATQMLLWPFKFTFECDSMNDY